MELVRGESLNRGWGVGVDGVTEGHVFPAESPSVTKAFADESEPDLYTPLLLHV